MKYICVGDMHVKSNHKNEVRLMIEQLNQIATNQDFDAFVILGDLHDSFSKIPTNALNLIITFFNELLKINKQIYYVIGNHDATNNQIFLSDDHAFNSFKNWHENLIIVDKPIKRDNVMFLPYVPVGRFKEATDVLGLDGINVIFCHQEFRGCKLGAKISEHGDIWEENLPIVISGHIHERSMVGNNILYVGSPYQTSFGDNSKKSIELVEINGSSVDTKPIELNMPKRITLNLTVAEFATVELPESIDYIRINVSGTLQDIASLKKSKKFKQISEIAKVVPKITDNMVISRNTKGKSFGELLAESMSGLSDEVKQEYEDILRSVT